MVSPITMVIRGMVHDIVLPALLIIIITMNVVHRHKPAIWRWLKSQP